jgi:hypothetical protein
VFLAQDQVLRPLTTYDRVDESLIADNAHERLVGVDVERDRGHVLVGAQIRERDLIDRGTKLEHEVRRAGRIGVQEPAPLRARELARVGDVISHEFAVGDVVQGLVERPADIESGPGTVGVQREVLDIRPGQDRAGEQCACFKLLRCMQRDPMAPRRVVPAPARDRAPCGHTTPPSSDCGTPLFPYLQAPTRIDRGDEGNTASGNDARSSLRSRQTPCRSLFVEAHGGFFAVDKSRSAVQTPIWLRPG